jgi:hypothetical protein
VISVSKRVISVSERVISVSERFLHSRKVISYLMTYVLIETLYRPMVVLKLGVTVTI